MYLSRKLLAKPTAWPAKTFYIVAGFSCRGGRARPANICPRPSTFSFNSSPTLHFTFFALSSRPNHFVSFSPSPIFLVIYHDLHSFIYFTALVSFFFLRFQNVTRWNASFFCEFFLDSEFWNKSDYLGVTSLRIFFCIRFLYLLNYEINYKFTVFLGSSLDLKAFLGINESEIGFPESWKCLRSKCLLHTFHY